MWEVVVAERAGVEVGHGPDMELGGEGAYTNAVYRRYADSGGACALGLLDSHLWCGAEPVGMAPIVPLVVPGYLALPAVAVVFVVVVPLGFRADNNHLILKLRPTVRVR